MKKILHLCLASFYHDNFNYQENILPKHHKLLGYDVKLIASRMTYLDDGVLGLTEPMRYLNEDGIPIVRIDFFLSHFTWLQTKLRIYKGLYTELVEFSPDIIFAHDLQFYPKDLLKYLSQNSVLFYSDCHTDFMNSARTFLSRNFLHKIIYSRYVRKLDAYVHLHWGVTDSRSEFLVEFYGINRQKVKTLNLGYDDTVQIEQLEWSKKGVANTEEKIFFVTGGRIDGRKNIIELIRGWSKGPDNAQLIVFGEPTEELKQDLFDALSSASRVTYLGWLSYKEILNCIASSDFAIFAGTHSVLWETSVGLGTPLILKYHIGYTNLDHNGNVVFINDVQEMLEVISKFCKDMNTSIVYKTRAMSEGRFRFHYSDIAKLSINHEA